MRKILFFIPLFLWTCLDSNPTNSTIRPLPQVYSSYYSTYKNEPVVIELKGKILSDSEELTFIINDQFDYGELSFSLGETRQDTVISKYNYLPNSGYTGNDILKFMANDGYNNSLNAQIYIEVLQKYERAEKWYHISNQDSASIANDIIELTSGGFFIGGGAGQTDPLQRPVIFIVDDELNLLHKEVFNQFGGVIAEMVDIGGSIKMLVRLDEDSNLLTTDYSGNIISFNPITDSNSNDLKIKKMISTVDDNILLFGHQDGSSSSRMFLRKIDFDENIIWEKDIDTNNCTVSGRLDIIEYNNNYYLTGTFNNCSDDGGFFITVDENVNLIQKTTYPNAQLRSVIHREDDNTFWISGTNIDGTNALYMQISSSGDILIENELSQYSNSQYHSSMINEGEVIFVGSGRNPGDVRWDILLSSLNGSQHKTFGYFEKNEIGIGIIQTQDGNYLLYGGGQYDPAPERVDNQSNWYKAHVLKLDNGFNIMNTPID